MPIQNFFKSLSSTSTRRVASRRSRSRRRSYRLLLEALEERTMLSTIAWINRGNANNDSDGFRSVFGANAELARTTARGALDLWQRVITDFKQSDGGNRIDVSINMAATGTGFGGSGGPRTLIGDRPRTGAITLNRGNDGPDVDIDVTGDGIPDPVGDGVDWFLDPTPLDNSEYNNGTILNPFAALPNPGSGIRADFMTLVTIEMAHVLGLANNAGLAWTNNPFVTNTNQADVRDAPGTLWTFDGPTVKGLLTSNNSGGGGTDTGLPVHVAYPPNQYFGPSLSYNGVADVGTAGGDSAIRYLPSHLMVHMLKDVYGYTITKPAEFGTFHAMLQGNGQLLIRGGSAAGLGFPSRDSINIFALGSNINVEIDLGNAVPGTGITGVMRSSFPASNVTSISIDSGDGDDFIRITPLQSNIPITIRGGTGRNTLEVVGSSGNDAFNVGFSTITSTGINITSQTSIDSLVLRPGKGVDDVYGSGRFTPFRIELDTGASRLNLHTLNSDSEVTINGGPGSDIINIAPNGGANAIQSRVTVNGGAGADTLNLGNGTLASFTAPITFNGGGGFEDKVVLNDQATTVATLYSVTAAAVTRSFGFGGLSYSDIDRIVLNLGSGADTVNVANGVFPNVEAHGNNGNDNFIIGGGNLTGIQPQSFNGGNGNDQITFDDHLGSTSRIWDIRNNEVIFGGLIVLSTKSFESVGISAGTGNDEFAFQGVLGQSFSVLGGFGTDSFILGFQGSVFFANPVTLFGGDGGDSFTINDAAVSAFASLSMDGGTGFNSMTVNEPLASGYVIGPGYFTPKGQGTFGFANMNRTVFNGNSANNLFTIYSAGSDFGLGSFTINGGMGNDSFVLAPQPSGYSFNNLTLNGNQGIDTFTLDASSRSTDESYFIGSNTIQIARGVLPNTITSSSMEQLTLIGGSGTDSVFVRATTGPVNVNGGAGADTVNVGNNGSVQNIRGTLTVTDSGGYSAVNVDNSADTVARTGIIYKNGAFNHISGLIPVGDIVVRGRDLRSLTILAGSGGNTFEIHDTPKSNTLGGLTTTIHTGTGSDQVTVNGTSGGLALNAQDGFNIMTVGSATTGLDRIQGAVSISGPGGNNFVTIHDRPTTAGRILTHTITAAAYTRTGAAPVSLSNVGNFVLLAGSAQDTINVQGNPTPQLFFGSFSILGGPGNDTFNFGNAANQLAGIGDATIDGEGGSDTLNIYDQGSTAPKTYTFGFAFGVASRPVFSSPDARIEYYNNESMSLNGGSGGNTIQVEDLSATTTLYPGTGNDLINVGTTANRLESIGSLNIVDQGGTDRLLIRDQGTTAARRYEMGVGQFVGQESRGGISARPLNSVINNWQTVIFDQVESVTLNAGSGGNLFKIAGTPAATSVLVNAGAGNDTVDVGSSNAAFGAVNSLRDMRGPLTIDGQAGLDQVTFNDQGTTTRQNYTLNADQLTRYDADGVATMAPIGFAALEAIALNGSSGGSTVFVGSTAAGASTTIYGQPGALDVFAVGFGTNTNRILGPVSVFGQAADNDFAYYYDYTNSTPQTYTVRTSPIASDAVLVERLGAVPISFGGLNQVIFFSPLVGGNTTNIQSLPASVFLNMPVSNVDTVTLGSLAPNLGGTLANILGSVAINSYSLNDDVTLVLDDSGNAGLTPKNVRLTPPVSPTGLANHIEGFAPNPVYWGLGANSSIALLGGAADETFALTSTAFAPAISINGGGGVNTLDYSALASGVVVNLPLGTASGLTGGIARIQNVVGSAGNDILVGNGGNVMTGGAGRDLLIAGALASSLNGGDDEDILIGGTTDYDRNATALMAIMSEWKRTDVDYATRVANLKNGTNGAPILNATRVRSNGGGNTLNGNAGLDFFFANLNLDILDRELSESFIEELVEV